MKESRFRLDIRKDFIYFEVGENMGNANCYCHPKNDSTEGWWD